MAVCRCDPPASLHIRPDGVHLPDGAASVLVIAEEALSLGRPDAPRCSVCAEAIPDTFFLCSRCDAVICRACVAMDTTLVECDCVEVAVTGVQRAALRAAAALH